MPDPSCICHLHHSSWQRQILNALSKARDRTGILMDTSQVCDYWATMGIPRLLTIFLSFFFFNLFRAAPVAYGSSQAGCQTGVIAASLRHSHSNVRSELCLQPTPLSKARDGIRVLMDGIWVLRSVSAAPQREPLLILFLQAYECFFPLIQLEMFYPSVYHLSYIPEEST